MNDDELDDGMEPVIGERPRWRLNLRPLLDRMGATTEHRFGEPRIEGSRLESWERDTIAIHGSAVCERCREKWANTLHVSRELAEESAVAYLPLVLEDVVRGYSGSACIRWRWLRWLVRRIWRYRNPRWLDGREW